MSRLDRVKSSTSTRARARRSFYPAPRRFAAIDIGSNSIRLVVAEAEADGTYRVLDEERDMARLGQGLAKTGRLDPGSMKGALRAIAKMKAIADGFKAEVRAVATSAVRDAKNGRSFRRAVRKRLGIRMEIISGREEGLLAFRSAARHFDLESQPTAAVDIGGGSLEIVLAKGQLANEVHSLPLGTVRLTEEFCRSDPLRPRHWKALRKELDKTLQRAVGKPPFPIPTLIGSGGTFTTLAQMTKAANGEPPGSVQGYLLSPEGVSEIASRLRAMSIVERKKIPGLNPKRADIIVAGATAVARTAKFLGVERILVNERGIRDGILLAMIEERLRKPLQLGRSKLRDRFEWVRLLARKCRSNERHVEHVARLALKIFDGLEKRDKLPPWSRDILKAAALLHEVGILINHEDHPKHAYHLIAHSGLTGFSARELELVANVARYQNGNDPKKSHLNFQQLSPPDRRLVRRLAGILGVAGALDRTQAQRISGIDCKTSGRRILLTLEARDPPHVELWDARRRVGLFESAFDASLLFRWKGKSARPAGAAIEVRKAPGKVKMHLLDSRRLNPLSRGVAARAQR